ncbi:sulfatase-like hydrolase/transferase [Nocardia tengchongensis]|uniref:sulfatase-like hydrolase/transferase n=1 Tax=Nocardia tengchongensis TaxID=2055889 RepID=UPI00361D9975
MSEQPMNVLVIMSDQHNPKILGAAGNPVVRTPNMDALAARGTRFESAYCASPICVPSRASFATGLYPHQTGYWDNAMGYDGAAESWGHELQRAGRRVESIGKLHYRNAEDPTGFDVQHLPMHLKDGIGQVWGSVRDPLPRRDNAPLMVTISGSAESDYTRYDAAVTDSTCAWLTDEDNHREPWVLYTGLLAPHFPYLAPPEYFDMYDPSDMPTPTMRPEHGHARHPWVEAFAGVLPGLDGSNTEEERRRAAAAYYGLVSYLDHNLGRILGALAASGQADNTLVVYTSDHGDMVGSRGLWGKSLLYTESAGVPLIMAGPGIAANSVCHTPASLVDLYPTILAAAGVTPTGMPRPGRSLLDIASGATDSDRVVFTEYHAMGATSGAFMIRRGPYVLHHYVGFDSELFDLAADPDQTTDLAGNPAYANVLADLEAELAALCDPVAVDKQAKADQAELVDRFGGPAAAAAIGTPGETPPPPLENQAAMSKVLHQ